VYANGRLMVVVIGGVGVHYKTGKAECHPDIILYNN